MLMARANSRRCATFPEHDSSSEKHGPIWDHDELSMASWLEDRLRWAVNKEPNYAPLACEGYILDRSSVSPGEPHEKTIKDYQAKQEKYAPSDAEQPAAASQ